MIHGLPKISYALAYKLAEELRNTGDGLYASIPRDTTGWLGLGMHKPHGSANLVVQERICRAALSAGDKLPLKDKTQVEVQKNEAQNLTIVCSSTSFSLSVTVT